MFGCRGSVKSGHRPGPRLLAVYAALAVELVLLATLTLASLRGSYHAVELGQAGWRVSRSPAGVLAAGAILGVVRTASRSKNIWETEPALALERHALARLGIPPDPEPSSRVRRLRLAADPCSWPRLFPGRRQEDPGAVGPHRRCRRPAHGPRRAGAPRAGPGGPSGPVAGSGPQL